MMESKKSDVSSPRLVLTAEEAAQRQKRDSRRKSSAREFRKLLQSLPAVELEETHKLRPFNTVHSLLAAVSAVDEAEDIAVQLAQLSAACSDDDSGQEACHQLRVASALPMLLAYMTREAAEHRPAVTAAAAAVLLAAVAVAENRDAILACPASLPLADLCCWAVQSAQQPPAVAQARQAVLPPLLQLISHLLLHSATPSVAPRAAAFHSYVLRGPTVPRLADRLRDLRADVRSAWPSAASWLLPALQLLDAASTRSCSLERAVYNPTSDAAGYAALFASSSPLLGIPSLLLSLLMHVHPRRKSASMNVTDSALIQVARLSLRLLNNLARLDLPLVQTALGDTGLRLELHHICVYILQSEHIRRHARDVVDELVLLLGYYVLACPTNQETLSWGQSPTPLRMLCGLPFDYFCDPVYMNILLPTLIAACHGCEVNLAVLAEEMSPDMLCSFIRSQSREAVEGGSEARPWLLLRNRFPIELWDAALTELSAASS
eukprot:PLAT11610.4.p1 GENE.PLAT11610.4~~PLAT11610.4.p1  ORF type:complete len:492 (+),score=165.78 PLAT11610.4:1-1476(+)